MSIRRPGTGHGQRQHLPFLRTHSLEKDNSTERTDFAEQQREHHHRRNPTVSSDTGSPPMVSNRTTHQRYVLTDPLAFQYLAEDPSTTILDREGELQGYECYIVESWVTSRTHPTFVVTTYTGNSSHVVKAGVLNVPTDEKTWSHRLRVYFRALNHYYATRRITELGILMVTNLSSFPSSLTVIPVSDGDVARHRLDFMVNKNLKRLGCSGRVGLSLTAPSSATVAKFHQLYRASDKNDIHAAVLELVRLCQAALTLFAKLEVEFADGLLCDVTERAVRDWWMDIGSHFYDIEANDGILGPITVAGLLGLLMGARNRLNAAGAPVGKDPFDLEAMKKGIGHFQKQQKMKRSRRLDRSTMQRLVHVTQKAANHDRWVVPKAVKSTVAELSGKGGEMVMDVVGRRDKAGIAEIETCDMDRFVQLIYGDHAKWLWYGKSSKNNRSLGSPPSAKVGEAKLNAGLTFEPDAQGGFTWTSRKSTVDGLLPKRLLPPSGYASTTGTPDDETDEDDSRHKSMFKRTSALRHEAKAGMGKLKGAVGLRGHQSRPSLDDSPSSAAEDGAAPRSKRPIFRRAHSSPLSSPASSPRSPVQALRLDAALAEEQARPSTDSDRIKWMNYRMPLAHVRDDTLSEQGVEPLKEGFPRFSSDSFDNASSRQYSKTDAQVRDVVETLSPSHTAEGSVVEDEKDQQTAAGERSASPKIEGNGDRLLQRHHSLNRILSTPPQDQDRTMPRQLSFSLAEEGVFMLPDLVTDDSDARYDDAKAQLGKEMLIAERAKDVATALDLLRSETVEWTQEQLRAVQRLVEQFDEDQQQLDEMFDARLEASNALQDATEGMLKESRDRFQEDCKEIETLISKLDYEIGGLRSRVEEVEVSVADFEKGVDRVEERVSDMERDVNRTRQCVVQ